MDTVLDVFEGALEALAIRDGELAVAKETRLREGVGSGGTALLLQTRERQREMDVYRAVSLERRSEATHSVVLLLHDLGMPYYVS